jgi:hypothetical protein
MAGIIIDLNVAKTFGLKEEDFKGKSDQEQLKILDDGFLRYKSSLELQSQKAYFENAAKVLPKVRDALKFSTAVYVKQVGQKKTESIVEIVGYAAKEGKVLVVNPESSVFKVFQVDEKDIIPSIDELVRIREERKTNKRPKSAKKPRKLPFGGISQFEAPEDVKKRLEKMR